MLLFSDTLKQRKCNDMYSIGQQLKTLRQSQKMTQQTVADKVGITRATLSNYEIDRRTPDLKTLRKLAECFGVGLDYFGIAPADEILDLLARAKDVFENDRISEERKNELFEEIMRLKLNLKNK
jgi:transcriptional regulator with XRE-family HTH domain